MGFRIFMLVMVLLIPLMMIGFGRLFLKKAPGTINAVFGYRTSMSMKNKDTWEFAHKYCGRLWFYGGLALVPLSVIPLLFVFHKGADVVGNVGAVIEIVQLVPLIGSIIPTEMALRKNFDRDGVRRQRTEAKESGKS